MSQFRQNLVTKEWVIIATERANRPTDYLERDNVCTHLQPQYDAKCPFCPSNEEMDLETGRIPQVENWLVRSLKNRFPAVQDHVPLERVYNGIHRSITGLGYHELIVEHRHHNQTWGLMTLARAKLVIEMFYNRGWEIQNDDRIEHVVYFKNHGKRAGASLIHPHSQIIAIPVVPVEIRQREDEARRHFDNIGQCPFCTMVSDELQDSARIIADTKYFTAFVLYAALSPFHIWIVPKRHSPNFLYTDPEERLDLALILRDVLRRLYIGLRDPAYNFMIRTSPIRQLSSEFSHWYVSIVPRLSRMAGFELGSGVFINPSLPEECAQFLRDLDIDIDIDIDIHALNCSAEGI